MIGSVKKTETLELSEDNIKDIIKAYYKSNGLEVVGDIKLSIEKKSWMEGFGMMETPCEKLIFHGTSIEVKKV